MQMKKVVVISMLAASLGATAVTPVMAQSIAATKQAVQVGQSTFIVNGNSVVIRTIAESGKTLVSIRDLSKAIGASLQVSNGLITAQLNHNVIKLQQKSVTQVNGSAFVEPEAFVLALGGAYVGNATSPAVTTFQLLADIDQAVWVNSSKLLVSKSIEDGREDYLVDALTGKYEQLLVSSSTSELVISPDGTKAAYSDANGAVYVITLSTKQAAQVSTDSTIKNELQWSNDGSSLFFLQGDKNSVVAKVNLADGSVSKVLEDKVDYKANLKVSADGTKFAYTVFKQPKVTADSAVDVDLDDVAIDATGTEPQAYFYNAAAGDNKPVQLTTGTDDKAFLQLSADGSKAYYVSLSADDTSVGSLVSIDTASAASSTVFKDQDVYQLEQSGSKLYLLTASGANNAIYEVDHASGKATRIHTVSDGVSELLVSANGQIAALSSGQLAVAVNGKFTTITR